MRCTRFGPSFGFASTLSPEPEAQDGCTVMISGSTALIWTLMVSAITGSFTLLLDDPFTILPIDDAASLACSCFNRISLWHFEHMFMVAALPKKPQLLMHKIGRSGGAWHPVSSWSIFAS
ncbi:hypothetical protein OIU78_013138, partial [Salix suchowensis]